MFFTKVMKMFPSWKLDQKIPLRCADKKTPMSDV